jgi:hypothetical protein
MLGATTVPLGHRQGLALRLLHCHLGVGMSSRLFVTMREEHGLAYDVGVHHPARLGAAPFVFHLSSSAERAFEATSELLNEWQRLLEQPLSREELALAQAKFRGQEAMGRPDRQPGGRPARPGAGPRASRRFHRPLPGRPRSARARRSARRRPGPAGKPQPEPLRPSPSPGRSRKGLAPPPLSA